ncbi:c-type cytochrome [uncultured Enterovirga sp.]|uniref:c-type cytochrome n=1 Tax=uncultured Enterovirga sp. TaxID=2026352 RepID=UPI0035CC44A1
MIRALATLGLVALSGGAAAADFAPVAPPGALSCSGCHALHPGPAEMLPRITGRPTADIVAALAAFRSGERQATVMNRIAKGFSEDESRQIAVWLGRIR